MTRVPRSGDRRVVLGASDPDELRHRALGFEHRRVDRRGRPGLANPLGPKRRWAQKPDTARG
ncbi:hypothetical protein BQ8420_04480 [Nocardiopsis sp. JB363]|nr:hypothetical protein BQ8420_04480 [Nocardiopsis sp. JB363]